MKFLLLKFILRFSKDNKFNPFAFIAFGAGPRNCIGMKFAYAEMQIALVKILRKFEFEKVEDFNSQLNFCDFSILGIADEINLVIRKREFK